MRSKERGEQDEETDACAEEQQQTRTREHRDDTKGVKGEGSRLTRLTDQPSKDPDNGFSRRGRTKRNSLVAFVLNARKRRAF